MLDEHYLQIIVNNNKHENDVKRYNLRSRNSVFEKKIISMSYIKVSKNITSKHDLKFRNRKPNRPSSHICPRTDEKCLLLRCGELCRQITLLPIVSIIALLTPHISLLLYCMTSDNDAFQLEGKFRIISLKIFQLKNTK